MTNVLHDRSSSMSLWRIDPHWNSQLLVEYSKDLFTCMILDDQFHEDGYSVRDGVIYYHGRIFFPRASKLKEKLLQAAHEDFLFSPTYSLRAYHTIMEGYFWEGFEEEIYQHMRRCMDHVEMEELAQPPLFSWRMRGGSSMSHSICMNKIFGKEHAHVIMFHLMII